MRYTQNLLCYDDFIMWKKKQKKNHLQLIDYRAMRLKNLGINL